MSDISSPYWARNRIKELTAGNSLLRVDRDKSKLRIKELEQQLARMIDTVEFAHSEGFEWPSDPFAKVKEPGDE